MEDEKRKELSWESWGYLCPGSGRNWLWDSHSLALNVEKIHTGH